MGDYWHCLNGEYTGIHIIEIDRLWIDDNRNRRIAKALALKHSIFRISFYESGIERNIVDISELEQAQALAEWYYKEWLKVNHNFDIETNNSYPLAKKLEVGHGKSKSSKGSQSSGGHN